MKAYGTVGFLLTETLSVEHSRCERVGNACPQDNRKLDTTLQPQKIVLTLH